MHVEVSFDHVLTRIHTHTHTHTHTHGVLSCIIGGHPRAPQGQWLGPQGRGKSGAGVFLWLCVTT